MNRMNRIGAMSWLCFVVACSGGASEPNDRRTDEVAPSESPPTSPLPAAPSPSSGRASDRVGGHSVNDRAATQLPMGTVQGVVRLAPGTALPRFTESYLTTAQHQPLPAGCTPHMERDDVPVEVGSSGGLTNLLVAAQGDSARWPTTRAVRRDITIEDCRLGPRVLIAHVGDTLHIVNETNVPFFPDFGDGMMRSIIQSDPLDLPVERAGARPVACGFGIGCGRLDLMVLHHPVHALSDGEGRFTIDNLPADQDITLSAWHPLFEEARETVRVGPGQTIEVELVIRPTVVAPTTVPAAGESVTAGETVAPGEPPAPSETVD